MKTRITAVALLVAGLFLAPAARAEIVITTDKPVYDQGEIVHVTIHNNGPEDAQFVSYPFIQIYHVDSGICVYGCVGLPVVTPFPAGQTVTESWDTGYFPDPPGTYLVYSAAGGEPATYQLTEAVGETTSSWGAIKAIYRD